MRKKKADLISELKTAENLLLEKHEELLICQDELSRIINEQHHRKSAKQTALPSPNSFKLNIFPRGEDAFQSSIEHMLSNESQPLDGLELDAIVSFIGSFIPIEEIETPQGSRIKTEAKEAQEREALHEAPEDEDRVQTQEEEILEVPEETPDVEEEIKLEAHEEETLDVHEEQVILEVKEENKTQEVQEEPKPFDNTFSSTTFSSSDNTHISSKESGMLDNTVSLSSAVRLHTQIRPLTTSFHPNTPFDLEVLIDPKVNAQANLESGRCKISIFSKNLSKDSTTLLGVLDESLESFEKESAKKISAAGLPQGFYRIEVVSTFTTPEGNQLPIASVNAGSFIHVT